MIGLKLGTASTRSNRYEGVVCASVIIPCRNEEKFISLCLESIRANDDPKDCLKLLVVDGMSDDGTRAVAVKQWSVHTTGTLRLPNSSAYTKGCLLPDI